MLNAPIQSSTINPPEDRTKSLLVEFYRNREKIAKIQDQLATLANRSNRIMEEVSRAFGNSPSRIIKVGRKCYLVRRNSIGSNQVTVEPVVMG